ncbi:MAG: hypothetical protein COB66_04460 [Coxiella sp. (in: Bacteria)]|nr:MAG: hypothetical protein COB66_04460 [Coxiella sp. (in: g-proteobacteria)]
MSRRTNKHTSKTQTRVAASKASSASKTAGMSAKDELTALKEKMALHESYFAKAQASVVKQQLHIEDLQSQLGVAQAEKLRFHQEIQDLQWRPSVAQVNQLLMEFDMMQTNYAILEDRFTQVNARNSYDEREKAEQQQKVDFLIQSNQHLQSQSQILTQANDKLEVELGDVSEQNKELSGESAELKSNIANLIEMAATREIELKKKDEDATRSENKYTDLRQEKFSLAAQLTNANSAYTENAFQSKHVIDTLNSQLYTAKYATFTMAQQLEGQNKALESRVSDLVNAADASDAKLKKMDKKRAQFALECAVLRPINSSLTTQLESISSTHAWAVMQLRQEISTLESQLEQAQKAAAPSVPSRSLASSGVGNYISLFQPGPDLLTDHDVASLNVLTPEEMALLPANYLGDTFS